MYTIELYSSIKVADDEALVAYKDDLPGLINAGTHALATVGMAGICSTALLTFTSDLAKRLNLPIEEVHRAVKDVFNSYRPDRLYTPGIGEEWNV